MAYENTAGIGVNNHYGVRTTGNAVGVETSDNSTHYLTIQFTGASLNETFLPPVYVPKGALFKSYVLRVDEAFAVSTAGTVQFGGTAPGTNGVTITEAELETIGTKVPASDGEGTWDVASTTGTTASQRLAKVVTGTVTATQGKATLICEYVNKTKV